MRDINSLGHYIKALRLNAGLDQKDIAKILGYKDTALISRIENNKSLLPLKTFKTLIWVLKADSELLKELYIKQCETKLDKELASD